MRVPLSWLAEYVDIDDIDTLANACAGLGLKVEAVHRPGEAFEGVVVGEVRAIADHPRADNLVLVDVVAGDSERRIVCGARNFVAGDRVPVALPGARLVDGVQIEKRTFKGEGSDGMLCSAKELGLGDDHSGIMVLPAGAEVGSDVREALGLNDVVFEFEIKPNRPDAMSIVGVARDLAALKGADLRLPDTTVVESGPPVEGTTGVTVEDVLGCPRYLARVIRGVRVGPSPSWVQSRLSLGGYRPISNVVDATNFALLVLGHPLHAFDLDLLGEKRIVVRRASRGEQIVTLDLQERTLDPEDLVIADASRAVAIAGVMGGAETEVSGHTTDILLESAYFDPVSILRTSKRHGLRTEASARFERGADPNAASSAADYAARLIAEWSEGVVAAGVIDRYPAPRQPITVSLRPGRANLLIGKRLSSGRMITLLDRLGFSPVKENGRIVAEVPTRRPDVTIEADLIEEITRLQGYDSVPARLPSGRYRAGSLTRDQLLIRRMRRHLAGAGLWEAQTSSLVGPDDLARMDYPEGHEALDAIGLVNALSVEESLLRPSLLPGLVTAVARNVARRNLSPRFFEIGRCFVRADDVLPAEPLRLGIAMHGVIAQEWHSAPRKMDFFDLKGVVEALVDVLRIPEVTYEPLESVPFHPTRAAAVIIEGKSIGVIGEISPAIGARYDLPDVIAAGELALDPLLEAARLPQVREAAKFPAGLVDLAVEVHEEVPAAAVVDTARSAGGDYLEEVRIFDVYRGEQIAPGNKSIAMSLRFRRPDRTLTDSEVHGWRDAIADAIAEAHGGRIRA